MTPGLIAWSRSPGEGEAQNGTWGILEGSVFFFSCFPGKQRFFFWLCLWFGICLLGVSKGLVFCCGFLMILFRIRLTYGSAASGSRSFIKYLKQIQVSNAAREKGWKRSFFQRFPKQLDPDHVFLS